MTPINFGLPGFFKVSGGAGIQEDLPPITSNLELYVDPDYAVFSDAGTTLAEDGDSIRQVWDRNSNGNTMNQTVATNQLTYKVDSLGSGNNSFYKDSILEWLDFSSDVSISSTESFTVYSVHKKASTPTRINVLGMHGGASSRNRIVEWDNGTLYLQDNDGTQLTQSLTQSTDIEIRTYVFDRASDEFRLYINNKLYSTGDFSALSMDDFNFKRLYNTDSGGSTMTGHFGRLLVYNTAHTSAQLREVSDWLGDKYDILTVPITSNLELYVSPDREVYSDAGTTLVTDGDDIRQINDLSTNELVLEQATASNQFSYVEDHFGSGVSAIYRDTAHGPHMDFATTLSITGTNTSLTFYTVYDKTTVSNISFLFGAVDNNYDRILDYANSRIYIQDTDGDNHYATITGATDLSIRTFVLDTSTDTISTYINGSLVNSSYRSLTWGDFNFESFWGGADKTYIGDTLLYNEAHDATQIGTITDWLNDKYGIY